MPGEFEPQKSIWLSWPHNEDTFPEFVDEIEEVYISFMNALILGQEVNLLVSGTEMEKKVIEKINHNNLDLKKIHIHKIPTVDVWIRDYGPNFLLSKDRTELAMNNWVFNAWGNKYDDLKQDNEIPRKIQEELLKIKSFNLDIVLEGGSIDVNGRGTLLTTEQCLLHENRNPHLSKEEIEKILMDYLNLSQIIWLKEGIEGDDTDGHVDDIARFLNPNTVVCMVEDREEHPNYQPLQENLKILKKSVDQDGHPLKIIELPMPRDVIIDDIVLPASYANFYIGNAAVVVPIFNDSNDQKVLQILSRYFPNRKIVGINCRNMVYGFGALHCSSQQEPLTQLKRKTKNKNIN